MRSHILNKSAGGFDLYFKLMSNHFLLTQEKVMRLRSKSVRPHYQAFFLQDKSEYDLQPGKIFYAIGEVCKSFG